MVNLLPSIYSHHILCNGRTWACWVITLPPDRCAVQRRLCLWVGELPRGSRCAGWVPPAMSWGRQQQGIQVGPHCKPTKHHPPPPYVVYWRNVYAPYWWCQHMYCKNLQNLAMWYQLHWPGQKCNAADHGMSMGCGTLLCKRKIHNIDN